MKILVVDDDENIREILALMLESTGVTDVSGVGSSKEAISTIDAQTKPFDCFFLDIQMPGGDGIELCREIRNRSAYRESPVIMVTAMTEASYIDRSFQAGATDYISKPLDLPTFSGRMRLVRLLLQEQQRVRDLSNDDRVKILEELLAEYVVKYGLIENAREYFKQNARQVNISSD